MAHPQQQGNAGPQQQAGAAPEDIWTPFIQEQYPDLLSQTYCLPPIFFYRTPQAVETVAGQTVLVRENPRSRGTGQQQLFASRLRCTGQQQPASPPAQVAGRVFVENPPDSQDVRTQDSDWQGDTAHDRCLQALSKIKSEVMFIISNLRFQNYLHNPANPHLPSIDDPSIPQNLRDGECDVIVIHRTYGLLIGEIKSVGDSDHFRTQTPDEQTQAIIKQIRKAVEQLDNQRTVLQHLVGDLPPIRITMTLLLPNISSSQLQSALSDSPLLLQTLSPTDVSRAVRLCLCQEDLGQPLTWWNNLHTAGPDQSMDDDLYQRLVARFCGPATTVDIPTAGPPRKVLRSFGEAVAETGLRFSSLMLTRDQVDLLNPLHEPQFMYLQGPPGTGKTVVLLLKALQCVDQGRQVVLVSGGYHSQAVTRLVEAQLHRSMGPAVFDPANIQRLSYDFTDRGFDAGSAVAWLQHHIRTGPVLVIFDEVDYFTIRDQYLSWLKEVRAHLPAVSVWGAGVRRWGSSEPVPVTDPLPPWVEVRTLQEPLRCPPSVTTHLLQSEEIQGNIVPQYIDPRHPVATHGPPVGQQQHRGQPGHSDDYCPWRCDMCSDAVVNIITRELRVGQPGQPLQYRDVLILYAGVDDPRADDVMVRRIQRRLQQQQQQQQQQQRLNLLQRLQRWLQRRRGPVRVVTSRPPGPDDVEELALATTDQVMITRDVHATGLERRVVIVLGSEFSSQAPLLAQSRCSGSLYTIQ